MRPWKFQKDLARLMNPMSALTLEPGSFQSCCHFRRDRTDEIEISRSVGAAAVDLHGGATHKHRSRGIRGEQALDPGCKGSRSLMPFRKLQG